MITLTLVAAASVGYALGPETDWDRVVFLVAGISGGKATWNGDPVQPFDARRDPQKWLLIKDGDRFYTEGNVKGFIVNPRLKKLSVPTTPVKLENKARHVIVDVAKLPSETIFLLKRTFSNKATPKGFDLAKPGFLLPSAGVYPLGRVPVVPYKLANRSSKVFWLPARGEFEVGQVPLDSSTTFSVDRKKIETIAKENELTVNFSNELTFELRSETSTVKFKGSFSDFGVSKVSSDPDSFELALFTMRMETERTYGNGILELARVARRGKFRTYGEVEKGFPALAGQVNSLLTLLQWDTSTFDLLLVDKPK